MQLADSNHSLYVYVSSIAGFDPVRTVYLCAPGWAAADAALRGSGGRSGHADRFGGLDESGSNPDSTDLPGKRKQF